MPFKIREKAGKREEVRQRLENLKEEGLLVEIEYRNEQIIGPGAVQEAKDKAPEVEE